VTFEKDRQQPTTENRVTYDIQIYYTCATDYYYTFQKYIILNLLRWQNFEKLILGCISTIYGCTISQNIEGHRKHYQSSQTQVNKINTKGQKIKFPAKFNKQKHQNFTSMLVNLN
jgi:hypothetical protein